MDTDDIEKLLCPVDSLQFW